MQLITSINWLRQLTQSDNLENQSRQVTYSSHFSISCYHRGQCSVLYLYAFQLVDEDVVIQPPLQNRDTLSGNLKSGMIALSFVGIMALHLLYIRVIMRYAF